MKADKFLGDNGMLISAGLRETERVAAAALWWRGIGRGVFACVPARCGTLWTAAALRDEAALCAFGPSGRLVGLAGLRGADGGLIDWRVPMRPSLGLMRSMLCRIRLGLWRGGPATSDMVLDGVVVHPNMHRRGVAGLLLEAALAQACLKGYSGLQVEVDIRNVASIKLHEKAGFDPIGLYRAGHNRKALVLRKAC